MAGDSNKHMISGEKLNFKKNLNEATLESSGCLYLWALSLLPEKIGNRKPTPEYGGIPRYSGSPPDPPGLDGHGVSGRAQAKQSQVIPTYLPLEKNNLVNIGLPTLWKSRGPDGRRKK